MDDAQRVELGSAAWVALATTLLRERLSAAGPLGDVDFSLCEVFTDPPPHLDQGDGAVAWWLAIRGDEVTSGYGRRDDVDKLVEADYATVLPRARSQHTVDPEAAPLTQVLVGLHNDLAPLTA